MLHKHEVHRKGNLSPSKVDDSLVKLTAWHSSMTKVLVQKLVKKPDMIFFDFGASTFFQRYELG